MTAEPSKPTRRLPYGSVAAPSNSNGIVTELVTPHGQVTGELQSARAGLANVGGHEGDLRVLLHGEEVIAAQVGIALLVGSRCWLPGSSAGRSIIGLALPTTGAALELIESAADLGDHRMPGDEPRRGGHDDVSPDSSDR